MYWQGDLEHRLHVQRPVLEQYLQPQGCTGGSTSKYGGGGRVVRWSWVNFQCRGILQFGGWSGGAMVLGKRPVPGRPTIWMIVGQGPTALAVVAGGVVWTFLLSSILSLLFLPLFGRRSNIVGWLVGLV